MDDRSFDRLARLLGGASDRRSGLKALVGGLLGAGGLAALDEPGGVDARRRQTGRRDARARRDDGPDAERRRKKKRKRCDPPCAAGFACVKGRCACASGVACGAACCAAGQACRDGACADRPEPGSCIAAGEPCKNVGSRCCDGRVCSSGQGGDEDIACYVPKTGRCERTADCVYGMRCQDGRCAPPAPGSLAEPCDAAGQQLCSTPGAACTAYTGRGAPNGTHCTLPLRSACEGDEDCTCYKCWYLQDGVSPAGARGRASTNAMGCCHPENTDCRSDQDCCLGLTCLNGWCLTPGADGGGGSVCVPDDASGCPGARCCSPLAICISGYCKLAIPTGDTCSVGQPDSLPCADAPAATCIVGDDETTVKRCRLQPGAVCRRAEDCVTDACGPDGRCAARTGEPCGASLDGTTCRETYDRCTDVGTAEDPAFECRSVSGTECGADDDCISDKCSGTPAVCEALTEERCETSNSGAVCKLATDTCSGTAPNQTCLRDAGVTCTAGTQCISAECGGTAPNQVCKALTRQTCGTSNNAAVCKFEDTTDDCRASYSDPTGAKKCLRPTGAVCADGPDCWSGACTAGVCDAATTEACGTSANGAQCLLRTTTDACVNAGTVNAPSFKCLRANGVECTAGAQCVSGTCGGNGQCAALTTEACETSSDPAGAECAATDTDACVNAGTAQAPNHVCLRANGVTCTANGQCVSGTCGTNGKCAALTTETCGTSSDPSGAECAATSTDACVNAGSAGDPDYRCLRANGVECDESEQCLSGTCGTNGQCAALTTEACGDSSDPTGAECAATDTDACVNAGTAQAPNHVCLRANGVECDGDVECVSGSCLPAISSATGNVCAALAGQACGSAESGAACKTGNGTCRLEDGATTGDTRCRRDSGQPCSGDDQCFSAECGANGVCMALTGETCGVDNNAAICKFEDTTDDCKASYTDPAGEVKCLRPVNTACTEDTDCWSGGCANDVCTAVTNEACGGTPDVECQVSGDVCHDTGAGEVCLRPAGVSCTEGTQCISGGCSGAVGSKVCDALTEEKCSTSNNGAVCKASTDTCSGTSPNQTCLRANGVVCTFGTQCISGTCGSNGQCAAKTTEACGTSSSPGGAECAATTDACADSGGGAFKCLRAVGIECTADAECASGSCLAALSPATGKVCAAPVGEKCGTAATGAACKSGAGTCRLAAGATTGDTRCRLDSGETCTVDNDCYSGACATAASPAPGKVCTALTGETCEADNNGAICTLESTTDDCRASYGDPTGATKCLRPAGSSCSAGTDCWSGGCVNDVCTAVTGETCGGSPEVTCQVSGDVCSGTTTKACLRPAGVACTAGSQCVSGTCGSNLKCAALTTEACGASSDPSGAQCAASTDACIDSGSGAFTCLRAVGISCATDDQCASGSCLNALSPVAGKVCAAPVGEKCGTAATGAACRSDAGSCRLAFGASTGDARCRRDAGGACDDANDCHSNTCADAVSPAQGKVCTALDGEPCEGDNSGAACTNAPDATCTTYADGNPTGKYCLRANGKTCAAGPGTITANQTCASEVCDSGTCVACTQDSHCPSATPVCNTATKTCVVCTATNAGACTGSTPVCDATAGACVQCTAASSSYCGTGDATGKPACDTTTSTCVQCTAANSSACTGSTTICDTTTRTCVQCTADDTTPCTGSTPVCDTATKTCVQCSADDSSACTGTTPVCNTTTSTCVQCTATSAAYCATVDTTGCTLYTCSASNTCTASGTKPANSSCTQSGGAAGYCQANGTCGASVACTFTRADCSNSAATCGTTLRTTIANAAQGAVIGIPAGTYSITSPIELDAVTVGGVQKNRQLTLAKCEGTNPVLDGGWNSSTSSPTGNQILKIGNVELTIIGVNFTKGYVPAGTFGGAIGVKGVPAATLDGSVPFIALKNLSITNNYSAWAGGGIYTYIQASLESVQITGNKSWQHGGGYYVSTTIGNGATLNGVTITGNTANLQGITNGAINGAGLYVNDAQNGDGLTCTGTNSITNSPASYVYDCGYDGTIPNKFAPNNFAGCGCATVECGNANLPSLAGTWNGSQCTCTAGKTWNGQQCVAA